MDEDVRPVPHSDIWWPAWRNTLTACSSRPAGTRTRSPSKLEATHTGTSPAAIGATIALSIPVDSRSCAWSPFHSATQASSAVSSRRSPVRPSGPNTSTSKSAAAETTSPESVPRDDETALEHSQRLTSLGGHRLVFAYAIRSCWLTFCSTQSPRQTRSSTSGAAHAACAEELVTVTGDQLVRVHTNGTGRCPSVFSDRRPPGSVLTASWGGTALARPWADALDLVTALLH